MAFADSQGTRIYYDDRGKGEPVFLCLPGWCVHQTIFAPLAERLSAHHRVLAMDWRGGGGGEAARRGGGGGGGAAAGPPGGPRRGGANPVPLPPAPAGWG